MKRNVGMKEGSVYELDGRVPLKKAMPLGIQHVLAMFLGNVSPLLIVCGLLDIALDMKTVLIQNAMFVAAIATLLQLYPIRRFGSRLPIVMGTSSGFIGTAQIIGSAFGYGALMGASMVGSLFEMVLGFFIRPLRKLFPPIVTSLVIVTMGLTLLPVGINYLGGGAGAADFGSLQHLGVGFFVMLVILIAKQMKGFINDISILIGIVAGYLLAIALGMVDFQPVAEAAWISLPQFLPVMPTFHMEAILAMGIMFVATAVETIGNISGITNGAFDREPTIEEMQGGVLADSAGSFFGSFFRGASMYGVRSKRRPGRRQQDRQSLCHHDRCGVSAAVRLLSEAQRTVFRHAAVSAGRSGGHHVCDDPGERHPVVSQRTDR